MLNFFCLTRSEKRNKKKLVWDWANHWDIQQVLFALFRIFVLINNDQRESFQEAATIVARTRRSLITRRLYSWCDTDEKRRQKTQKNKDGNFGAVTRVEKQYREKEFSNINPKLTDMEKERKGNTNTKGAAAREKATPLLRQPSRD